MHERERHRIILSAVQEKPVITIQDLVELTEASEATLRRDIASLHMQGRIKRVRGGAEAIHPPQFGNLAGRPFKVSETENTDRKRAIAREAVALCEEGDSIIINGGSTTFQMVHYLAPRRLQVLTNSFAIAEHLLRQSKSTVIVPGGAIYRDQSLILSPFDNDVIRNFYGRRMFMGCQGISPLGVMESDALIIQSEQKLMGQADELVLMVDSTKFTRRSSLILCPLDRVSTLITDDGISDDARRMVENAGIRLIVAQVSANADKGDPREDSAEVA
ncbi:MULTISPECIES: DeoR/GlpR family DNA-binding transcription regulator [Brucella/Ochrobactrum group]|uniref:DeoR/GlpR transcriptional regulator n=1 Tax=Brucella lupini TaxID=255457 RepID=A0A256GCF0_9HYPH|nr:MULTISPECIES: DeoR/GlpR family DNA-binding transcription regulator [Brucella/Ochrobactrum group]RNL46247.1 DeoR/GlpR transcriptional regulator [Ochrobactrum sp. MH181795]KAB2706565.1 DeoR/GlpR transcriptional regulator [Brucella lupini]KAB2725550.1 DeoR/GlpR transcriptional regulator [Brucella anthropi]KAB2742861.1 DeoR/GlpR transcriptional regulator [Brucella anthropi]KAB2765119.1 DeoR/GlpR transcriptional regulator [Brucella anthropi]